ncbi:MAG: hypothetical protein JNL82_15395 [Myxococcales bacterium]|nr:hypothetical protein [Myxococcales bacterium]
MNLTENFEGLFEQASFRADLRALYEQQTEQLRAALSELDTKGVARPPQNEKDLENLFRAHLSAPVARDALVRFLIHLGTLFSVIPKDTIKSEMDEFCSLVQEHLSLSDENAEFLLIMREILRPRAQMRIITKASQALHTREGRLERFNLSLFLRPLIEEGKVLGITPVIALKISVLDEDGNSRTVQADLGVESLKQIQNALSSVRGELDAINRHNKPDASAATSADGESGSGE